MEVLKVKAYSVLFKDGHKSNPSLGFDSAILIAISVPDSAVAIVEEEYVLHHESGLQRTSAPAIYYSLEEYEELQEIINDVEVCGTCFVKISPCLLRR